VKKLLFLISLFLITGDIFANEIIFGSPTNLTLTATTLSSTYIVGSANSTTAWTFVRGSNLGALRWCMGELSGTYNLNYTYNPLTYTVSTDLGLWPKNTLPMERYLYLPNGFYVNVTFTTVYSGTAFSTTVYYEGQK
jgi:hypothetical protein